MLFWRILTYCIKDPVFKCSLLTLGYVTLIWVNVVRIGLVRLRVMMVATFCGKYNEDSWKVVVLLISELRPKRRPAEWLNTYTDWKGAARAVLLRL